MPVYPLNLGYSSWGGPNAGSFRPTGRIEVHGVHTNPILYGGSKKEKPPKIWACRIFVGLNVGKDPRWDIDDVIRIVKRVRSDQVGKADSSFIYQRGMYTQVIKGEPELVDENSVQLAITNMPHWGIDKGDFKDQMVELAEILCKELEQDSVICEIQKNGLLVHSWTIGA